MSKKIPMKLQIFAEPPQPPEQNPANPPQAPEGQQVSNMYDLLFSEKARKTIEELKLSFDDLKIVVQTAITLIAGKEEEAGESQIPATT